MVILFKGVFASLKLIDADFAPRNHASRNVCLFQHSFYILQL